jgi:hypothetical protein
MSVMIDNTEELLTVVRKLGIKVGSLDELTRLLTTINASYNPDAARQKTGKQIGVVVPCSMISAAGVATFFIVLAMSKGTEAGHIAGLALIWGACALVCMTAMIASALMTRRRPELSSSDNASPLPASYPQRGATGIVKELEI